MTTPAFPPDRAAAGAAGAPRQHAVPGDGILLPHAALLAEAGLAYRELRQHPAASPGAAGVLSWEGFEGSAEHAMVFEELHGSDPAAAERLARAVTALPRVGNEFLGFRLLAELARGAFGRVYLAGQGELANRLVVLKVVPDLLGEPQALAQLQHTHIVPLYGVQDWPARNLRVLSFPYLGGCTWQQLLDKLRGIPLAQRAGQCDGRAIVSWRDEGQGGSDGARLDQSSRADGL